MGLVGLNGAGKTTLLKHILGMYRAQQGSVSVFGNDPSRNPVAVLSRVGYLTEEDSLPGWMTAEQLLSFSKSFYPDWDDDYEKQLLDTFDLEPSRRIDRMSKGQKARVGLTVALAHRPELLVLDEPGSGLDPVVRNDILTAIIRTIADRLDNNDHTVARHNVPLDENDTCVVSWNPADVAKMTAEPLS